MKKFVLTVIIVSLFFISCSSENEKDLMNSAKEKIANQQYVEALIDLEKITQEYSETNESGLAYLEMAKIYQGKAIKTMTERNSFIKAVEYYQIVSEEYSELDEAPGALFMSGFLQANEIHDYESAKTTYESFLAKYPDHELAPSAQSELDNLGLTPEQILEKAVAQPK